MNGTRRGCYDRGMKKHALNLVVGGVAITFFFGIIFLAVQQSLRLGANEPQASMARELSQELVKGTSPQGLVSGTIDMEQSMQPFTIVYNKMGQVVAGNGYLDGKIPRVPIGVLQAATPEHMNEVTWQPKEDVRVASVSALAGSYYVLGGRSLVVVESQVMALTVWMAIAWLVSLAAFTVVYMLLYRHPQEKTVSQHRAFKKSA